MGIVFRQSIKSSISIFAGALLGALTIYLSTLYLPKQELGFRSTLINLAVVGAQIFLLGVHNTLSVYIHKYNDDDKRKSVIIGLSFVLPVLSIAVASIFYFLFKSGIISLAQEEDAFFLNHFFAWLPLFTLLFSYQMVLETFLISQFKTAKAYFLREVLLRALNIVALLLYGFGYINFDILIYATILLYIVPITFMLFIALRTDVFRFNFNLRLFTKAEQKEITHFTWFHSLLSISITLLGTLDALMLASLSPSGLKSVAVYSVSIFIISFLQIPYRSMLSASFPVLNRVYNSGDQQELKTIFSRSSMNVLIASTGMFLLIACNLHNAVAILPRGYEGITAIVLILSAGRMVDLATGMNDQLLSISKYYKSNFYLSLVLVLLIICLNYWLIPIYDLAGAAWATSIALIIYNLMKYFIVKTKLDIQPFSGKTWYVVITGIVVLLLGYYLPRLSNPFADAAYRSSLVILLYGIILLVLKPSPDLNQFIASVKKNKRLF